MSLLSAVVLLPTPTDALCVSFVWLLGIGFILVYGYSFFHSLFFFLFFFFSFCLIVLFVLFSFLFLLIVLKRCLFIKSWALYMVWLKAIQYKKSNMTPMYIMKVLGAALLIEIVSYLLFLLSFHSFFF